MRNQSQFDVPGKMKTIDVVYQKKKGRGGLLSRPRPLAEEAKHRNRNESSDQVPEEMVDSESCLNREWKIFYKPRKDPSTWWTLETLSGLCKEGTDLTLSVKASTNEVGDETLT